MILLCYKGLPVENVPNLARFRPYRVQGEHGSESIRFDISVPYRETICDLRCF